MSFDKESIYDEKLYPLIADVISICKKEGIPFAMTFGIKEEDGSMLYCSSWGYGVNPYPDIDVEHFDKLVHVINPR